MTRDTKTYTLFSGYDGSTGDFTAATTDIITDAAHGLSEDDPVVLTTTTTLPAGLELLTVYYAVNVTTDTFQLSTTTGNGEIVDITDTGTGTHTWTDSNLSNILFGDGKDISITLSASGTVAMTVKCLTSDQELCPNFFAAASADNEYDTTETVDLQSGDLDDGDSGFSGAALAAAAVVRYAINTDQSRWAAVIVTARTNGTLTARGRVAID